jgi:hypothetical protein
MANAIETADREIKKTSGWSILSSMAIVVAANAALMFAMIGTMTWQESVALIFTAGALTGGALFTVWTMQDLCNKK